jgi:hypothetical protein
MQFISNHASSHNCSLSHVRLNGDLGSHFQVRFEALLSDLQIGVFTCLKLFFFFFFFFENYKKMVIAEINEYYLKVPFHSCHCLLIVMGSLEMHRLRAISHQQNVI